jgi:hypothetical protein
VGKRGELPFGRLKRRWVDNITVNLGEIRPCGWKWHKFIFDGRVCYYWDIKTLTFVTAGLV